MEEKKIIHDKNNKTIWEVTASSFDIFVEHCSEDKNQVIEKNINAEEFDFYLAENIPCLAGDDLCVAWNKTTGDVFSTFDGWISQDTPLNSKELDEALDLVINVSPI